MFTQAVDVMERAQDAKLDELQRVRQLNLSLRSRLTTLDERLKRKVPLKMAHHGCWALQCMFQDSKQIDGWSLGMEGMHGLMPCRENCIEERGQQ